MFAMLASTPFIEKETPYAKLSLIGLASTFNAGGFILHLMRRPTKVISAYRFQIKEINHELIQAHKSGEVKDALETALMDLISDHDTFTHYGQLVLPPKSTRSHVRQRLYNIVTHQ